MPEMPTALPERGEIRDDVPRMEPLATLPVFLKLNGKRAVLVGGTEPAAWKAELLAAAGAHVDVYAENFAEEFAHLVVNPPAGQVTLHTRCWQPGDLNGAAIAVGAITGDEEAEAFVAAARVAGVPVNVVDRPQFCAFQFGAIVNRSPLIVSISTDGASPVFGQAIRSMLEGLLPAGFKRWAAAAKVWRGESDRLGPTIAARRRFWERFAERAMSTPDHVPTANDLEELIALNNAAEDGLQARGFVALIGVASSDAEDLTMKAVRALRTADVVIYDESVADEVLGFARRESQRVCVATTGGGSAGRHQGATALMIDLARQGQRVVRLRSLDSANFARGGGDAAALEAARIAFTVIPGIAAVGA